MKILDEIKQEKISRLLAKTLFGEVVRVFSRVLSFFHWTVRTYLYQNVWSFPCCSLQIFINNSQGVWTHEWDFFKNLQPKFTKTNYQLIYPRVSGSSNSSLFTGIKILILLQTTRFVFQIQFPKLIDIIFDVRFLIFMIKNLSIWNNSSQLFLYRCCLLL